MIGLFIFRRDLRIVDNIALAAMERECSKIYTIFVFTREQVTSANKFKSDTCVRFMIESLQDLSEKIADKGGELGVFFHTNVGIIGELIRDAGVKVVGYNTDITPYARERDAEIAKLCEKAGVKVVTGADYYLNQPGTIVNGSGAAYQKFTPYYVAASRLRVSAPSSAKITKMARLPLSIKNKATLTEAAHKFVITPCPSPAVRGGRDAGLAQMRLAATNVARYAATRDDLSKPTSRLSAYLKFGCVSVREVYAAFKTKRDFTRQLYWRDFYANIMFAYPHVLARPLKAQYSGIKWQQNQSWFKQWCDGRTGFPIVDAGMRELNATGFCHNRARLVVMSFLVKVMLIDYRLGEKYFATKLIDYDPSSNNGNTQWVMGGGADSMPYFRIFNPWEQARKHDSNCAYVKKWVPELRNVPPADILAWDKAYAKYARVGYPAPVLEFSARRDVVLAAYHKALK